MVQLVHFQCFKLGYLLISSKAQENMFSNIEEPYEKLPKHLNSAITKLFYCFLSKGTKNGRNTKIGKISHFFWLLNLHVLLERAFNHIKLYLSIYLSIYLLYTYNIYIYIYIHIHILKVHLEKCPETPYLAIAKYPGSFLDALKTSQILTFFMKLASQKSMFDYLKTFKT